MKPYFFGYLFVRLAKVLATLVFVTGVAVAIFSWFQASLESRATRYVPSARLGSQLRVVRQLQAEAWQTVAGFKPLSGNVDPPPMETVGIEPFTRTPPMTTADFASLDAVLDSVTANDVALKRYLLARFETSITNIRSQLLAHAQEITPAVPSSTPSAASTPAVELPSLANGIYSTRLSDTEILERNATLDRARETLKVLAAQAEKAQNKQILTASVNELDSLQPLLPVPLAAGHQDANEPAREGSLTAASSREPKAAEMVAVKLQGLVGEVRQVICSSWAFTEATDEAARLAAVEKQECRQADFALKRIWQHTYGMMVMLVFGGAFLAFLLLAMTDLTKALLDAATHSGVVAEAYRMAAPVELPEAEARE